MDFDKVLDVAFRKVGRGERNGSPTHIVRGSRIYHTTQADLWSAVTEKERLRRWFGDVSGDLTFGGRFSIQGNADGDIVTCDPPKSLAVTWEFGGTTSWVRATIEEADDGVILTIEHELPTDTKSEEHWDKYGPGAVGVGWELWLLTLNMHLCSGGKPSTEAAAAWIETPQGKVAMQAMAEAWGNAHIVAGSPAKIAEGMAERTAKFYTGQA